MGLIDFSEVSKSYKRRSSRQKALDGLSLSVEAGEVFGFLGPNGAGKSTAIKILMNFIKADKGRVRIKEIPIDLPEARRHIGFLPENPCFYDHLTAAELLKFIGVTSGMDRQAINARTDALLTELKLAHAKNQPIRTYSKGMTQRIGLAMAMLHDPDIYILDEPMSGLDPLGRRLVADLIQGIHQSGKTIFFSSHILSDIERLCDRVGILHQGRLLFCGPLDDFVEGKDSLETAFVELIASSDGGAN
jgi:ABC-2 type transport system ATP-binding protein